MINIMKTMHATLLKHYVVAIVAVTLWSCATQKTNEETASNAPAEQATVSEQKTVEPSTDKTASAQATETGGEQMASVAAPEEELESVPQIVAPPKIVEECKKEPYVQYEKQSRESINHGWEATKAQRFGVGFRDADEYKKWSNTHNEIFAKVSEACNQLSECAKQNKTDSKQKCADKAQRFDQWQKLAKEFIDKVKTVESTQPPMLCSITPSNDDSSQCFNLLADKIDASCDSDVCKETSSCFRGVYVLDDAINQAELACGFVGQKLSECRGYIEATARRKSEFDQCLGLYKKLQVEILPVI